MRREFSARDDLASYLAAEFPQAAAVDANLSPTRGGQAAAASVLNQIQPAKYGSNRNYLDGSVSRLSPYIRHGLVSLREVKDLAFSLVKDPTRASKFISELAWRDYWQRLYAVLGRGVWEDREEWKTGHSASAYRTSLPGDIADATTGLACIDAFVGDLRATGYLHNHARMWFAAYVVHYRRVHWKAGALFFLSHLLDGDPASNNLSWQWVASTFSHKPYFFNRENLERYTHSRYCAACPQRHSCEFDGSYEQIGQRLFRIEGL